jgi:uncharacterized membrane protein
MYQRFGLTFAPDLFIGWISSTLTAASWVGSFEACMKLTQIRPSSVDTFT